MNLFYKISFSFSKFLCAFFTIFSHLPHHFCIFFLTPSHKHHLSHPPKITLLKTHSHEKLPLRKNPSPYAKLLPKSHAPSLAPFLAPPQNFASHPPACPAKFLIVFFPYPCIIKRNGSTIFPYSQIHPFTYPKFAYNHIIKNKGKSRKCIHV